MENLEVVAIFHAIIVVRVSRCRWGDHFARKIRPDAHLIAALQLHLQL
jgi:hypothetical protein